MTLQIRDFRAAHMRNDQALRQAIQAAAHLLPAQGPIPIFIHHNTLHAFEHLPFDRAVAESSRRLGAEPYLPESEYRADLARGRILDEDLRAVLEGTAGDADTLALRLALLRHPVIHATGVELRWLLAESDPIGSQSELWEACLCAVAALEEPVPPPPPRPVRPRDLLLAVTGRDTDALVHPLLIRLVAAFLDQGVAQWPMPDRATGLRPALLSLLASAPPPAFWLTALPDALREESALDPIASSLRSLAQLGVPAEAHDELIATTLLALKGYAGMIHQLETRPDRAPVFAPNVTLLDFLAVRLLLDRLALEALARESPDLRGPAETLRARLIARLPAPAPPAPEEAAFLLFQLARILELPAAEIRALGAGGARRLLAETRAFSELDRRRTFHAAFERRHTIAILDALASHARAPAPPAPRPSFQATFCIDEREESIRRHLEETDPTVETFGAAGFFGVPMYYRGLEDAHHVPLCPIAIRPRHEVTEHPDEEARYAAAWRRIARSAFVRLAGFRSRGSRTFGRGLVLTLVLGAFAALPLVLRVLFPRLAGLLRRHGARTVAQPPRTRLALERSDDTPEIAELTGFDKREMAAIVRGTLEEIGLRDRLAPIVLMIGHGSSSSNNPHASAYDCGACGGARGGPNARAFARMANDPRRAEDPARGGRRRRRLRHVRRRGARLGQRRVPLLRFSSSCPEPPARACSSSARSSTGPGPTTPTSARGASTPCPPGTRRGLRSHTWSRGPRISLSPGRSSATRPMRSRSSAAAPGPAASSSIAARS